MSDLMKMFHVEVYGQTPEGKPVKGNYVAVAKSEKRLRKLFKGNVVIKNQMRLDKGKVVMDLGAEML